jgi:hypothetical protein
MFVLYSSFNDLTSYSEIRMLIWGACWGSLRKIRVKFSWLKCFTSFIQVPPEFVSGL